MNKKLSAEKRAARQARLDEWLATHKDPGLRLKPSEEHMEKMAEEMKKLAIQKALPPLSDEDARMEAQRFVEYIELGFNIMKRAADAGKLSEEETKAIRTLEPILR